MTVLSSGSYPFRYVCVFDLTHLMSMSRVPNHLYCHFITVAYHGPLFQIQAQDRHSLFRRRSCQRCCHCCRRCGIKEFSTNEPHNRIFAAREDHEPGCGGEDMEFNKFIRLEQGQLPLPPGEPYWAASKHGLDAAAYSVPLSARVSIGGGLSRSKTKRGEGGFPKVFAQLQTASVDARCPPALIWR